MPDIRFEPLPSPGLRGRGGPSGDSYRIAVALKGRPGDWAVIKTYGVEQHSSARGYSARVNGGKTAAYTPVGHYEATIRQMSGEIRVYARYVGEGGDSDA